MSTLPSGEVELAALLKLNEGAGGAETPAKPAAKDTLVALPYTNESLVDYIVANPGATPDTIARNFGRTRAWFLATLASDHFQLALDPKRHLIADTTITATMEERFRALTLHSLSVLQRKLDNPEATDLLVLKSAEIGVKALGLGIAKPAEQPLTSAGGIDTIADRLVAALEKQRRNVRAIDAEVTVVSEGGQSGS